METRDSPRDNFELGKTMVGVVIRIPLKDWKATTVVIGNATSISSNAPFLRRPGDDAGRHEISGLNG